VNKRSEGRSLGLSAAPPFACDPGNLAMLFAVQQVPHLVSGLRVISLFAGYYLLS
jgi:hypothetical protein